MENKELKNPILNEWRFILNENLRDSNSDG